jgi:hypothetical protein
MRRGQTSARPSSGGGNLERRTAHQRPSWGGRWPEPGEAAGREGGGTEDGLEASPRGTQLGEPVQPIPG